MKLQNIIGFLKNLQIVFHFVLPILSGK